MKKIRNVAQSICKIVKNGMEWFKETDNKAVSVNQFNQAYLNSYYWMH